jgi:hypothetical protein
MWSKIVRQFQEVNKELWLLLMMFAILAGVNYLISSERFCLRWIPRTFAGAVTRP